jgi:NhaP-type Na+/H+ or K+/H+ antiporter
LQLPAKSGWGEVWAAGFVDVPGRRHVGRVRWADALNVFDLVFFVVVVSAFIPGATVQRLANWLKLDETAREEIRSTISSIREPAPVEAPTLAG